MLKLQLEMYAVILMTNLKTTKDGDITEDDLRSQTEDVQKLTDDSIKQVDELLDEKEKDIMSV